MELVSELFFTAFLAIVFSFLVAKLVSIAMAVDVASDSSEIANSGTVVEELKSDRGLRVENSESENGVQSVQEDVEIVEKFEGERSIQVQENLEGPNLAEICGDYGRIEVEETLDEEREVVGLSEDLSAGRLEEELTAEMSHGDGFDSSQGGDEGVTVIDSSEIADSVTVVEELKSDRALRVENSESETGVQSVQEDVEIVEKFEGERSIQLQEDLEGPNLVEICDDYDRIEVEGSPDEEREVVGLSENLSSGRLEEELTAEMSHGDGFGSSQGGDEGVTVTGSDELFVEERSESESTKGAEIFDDDHKVNTIINSSFVEENEKSEEIKVEESRENQGNCGIETGGNEKDVKLGPDDEDDDDDWEGIERSDMENVFSAASNYVLGDENRLGNLGSDVQMELYGLHKVAMEGPCHEPQPMALNFSARAKWNAWQKLGNMSPDVAMEQYVTLLSEKVPGWMDSSLGGGGVQYSPGAGMHDVPRDTGTDLKNQPSSEKESILDPDSSADEGAGPFPTSKTGTSFD